MNNLEKAIETLSDLLDEMSDKMDIDEKGNPDDAMCWATQLSDVLVRLKRHTKADTKTGVKLCQQLLEALQPLRFDVWADHYEENRLWYEPCEEGSFLYYDQVVAILKTQSQEQQQ